MRARLNVLPTIDPGRASMCNREQAVESSGPYSECGSRIRVTQMGRIDVSMVKYLAAALFVGSVVATLACTTQRADESKKDAGAALDETRAGVNTALDATKKAGSEALDAGKDIALATGSAVTDGWVTTKLKAKFADETVLDRSDIRVDTTHHVVTLKGTVRSSAARSRAVEIAAGTEGVARVVDQLVVKNN